MTITGKKVISIAIIITAANIAGKFLGFGKDILISYYYGTSAMTDALFFAMSVPTLILGVFTSASDSAIIPQYNRISATQGRKIADEHFSGIINILGMISIFVSLLLLFSPSVFVNTFVPGFSDIQKEYSAQFLRIFSFFGFLHIMYCFFSAYNVIYNNVITRAILSFSTSIIVILALLINPDDKMVFLSLAFLIGYLIHGIFPIITAVKAGYMHQLHINIKDDETKQFIKIFIPIMSSAFLMNINMYVDRFLASNMGEGSISALNYASRLTMIFDSMLVAGMSIIILPVLSQTNISGKRDKFKSYCARIIKITIIMLTPIMVISLLLAPEIIQAVYMRGKFDINSAKVVSGVFLFYSPQILFISLQAVLAKTFHSIEDTKTPFKATAIGVILNIIVSIILSFFIGLNGIALATSISVIISCIILAVCLAKNVGWDGKVLGTKTSIKIIISVILMIMLITFTKRLIDSPILSVVLCGIVGIATYFVCIYILLPHEISELKQIIKK